MHVDLRNDADVRRLKLPPGAGVKRIYFRSNTFPGLSVHISKRGVKTFHYDGLVKGGKTRRVKLGVFDDNTTLEEAEERARQVRDEMRRGIDPSRMDKMEPSVTNDKYDPRSIRLADVLEHYLDAKTLRASTAADYRKKLRWGVSDWMDRDLQDIEVYELERRHKLLGTKRPDPDRPDRLKGSPAQADGLMRVLRALWAFSIQKIRGPRGRVLVTENRPALAVTGQWHGVQPRRNYVTAEQMPAWMESVLGLHAQPGRQDSANDARDLWLWLLFTGCRVGESLALKPEHIDIDNAAFTLTSPKNAKYLKDGCLTLPMNSVAMKVATRRLQSTNAPYLWPGNPAQQEAEWAPMHDPRRWRHKLVKSTGIEWTNHDLRRTFKTHGVGAGVDILQMHRLTNHLSGENVGTDYVIRDLEVLRDASETTAQELVRLSENKSPFL